MPYNGTGTFNRIYSWVTDAANGILVRSDRMDTDTNDIASGLSNCITRDGQSPPTAAIPMGSQKITGLANGVAAQDATTVLQVFTAPTFVGPVTVSSGGVAITGNSTLVGTLGSLTGLSSSGTVSFTTGTTTVATVAPGDNSTNAASTAFVATSYAPLASPALTGVPTAPSAAAGTNTTQIATTAYVQTTAFSAALPSQTGNAGKTVGTNGTAASWEYPGAQYTGFSTSGNYLQSQGVGVAPVWASLVIPTVPSGATVFTALNFGAF